MMGSSLVWLQITLGTFMAMTQLTVEDHETLFKALRGEYNVAQVETSNP